MRGNWNMKWAVVAGAVVLFCSACLAKQEAQGQSSEPLQHASATVDKFLKGVKLADLPEGKAMLAETEWMPGGVGYRLVVYTDAKTIYEGMFDTDLSGIRGYKRLIEMDAVSEAHTPLKVRYIAIAYPERQTGEWKVLATGTDSEIDIDERLASFQKRKDDTGNLQANDLLWYGHYLLMAGRIKNAKAALLKAKDAYATNPPSLLASKVPGLLSLESENPELAEHDRKLSQESAVVDNAHIEGLLSVIEHVSGPGSSTTLR